MRTIKAWVTVLALASSSWGTCTIVQHASKVSCGSGNLTCTLNATQGWVATGAHHLIIAAEQTQTAGQTITAVSGGGTYAHCDGTHTNCAGTEATGGESTDIWTTLNSTSGATSVTVTRSGSAGTWAIATAEVSCTGTLVADNSGNNSTSTLGTSQAGVGATLTGNNDFAIQMLGSSAGTPNSLTQGYTVLENAVSLGFASLNNTTNGTQPTWTMSSGGRSAASAVWISDSQPSGNAGLTISSGVSITSGLSLGKGSGNPKTLQSISVTPTTASTGIGGIVNYTATGTYSDSSTADITLQAAWASSNTSVATVGAAADPQPVTAIATGSTFIDATFQSVTSNDATLTVTPTTLSVTTTSCPLATQNLSYSCQLNAIGGVPSYTWAISVGTLPTGLSLNAFSGLISGTPTVVGGPTLFTAQVTDSATPSPHTATQQLSISVAVTGDVTDENFYDNTDGTCKNMPAQDGPANLPTKCFNTALANTPSPGGFYCVAPNGQTLPSTCTGSVSNFTSITAAFAAVASGTIPCGSTIKIVATSNGLSTGTQNIYDEANITYPAVSCNNANWMTVETDMIASLPSEQTRISPAWVNIPSLPGRPSYNQPAVVGNYMPMIRNTVFASQILKIASTTSSTAPIASFVRFIGLEIAQPGPGTSQCVGHNCQNQWNNFLITTGCDPASKSVICPDHIIFDRIIADPDAHTGIDTTTVCFGINGSATNLAIINSYFYGIKIPLNATGNCEAKAFGMGNNTAGGTQGPYKIVNTFAEASAEVMFWGGGFSVNDATNVEVRRNHLYKPFNLWMPGKPGYLGGLMLTKNLYESKSVVQALIEGNIMEYNWYGHDSHGQPLTDQFGTGVLLHSAEGNLGQSHKSVGQDVTFRYNWIRHAARSVTMDISGCDSSKAVGCGASWPPGDVSPLTQRESVHDNFFDDISGKWFTPNYSGGGSGFDGGNLDFTNSLSNVGINGTLNNLAVNHNTIIASSYNQDLTATSISTNGSGTATLNYSGSPPAGASTGVGRKIQIFGSCAGFNEYATIATTATGTFTYTSSAPANSSCNSGFVSLLDPTTFGSHLNEGASDNPIVAVSESGSLAEVTVNVLTKPAFAIYQIMCVSAGVPAACKAGQQTTFTVYGLTGALSCYNSNQSGCGSGGTTTTPATWILAGRATCSATGIGGITIGAGGTGYAVNDVVTVVFAGPPAGVQGTLTITSVSGGVVTGLSVATPGTNYAVANGLAVTGGHGTGLTVNVTSITSAGAGAIIGGGTTAPCTGGGNQRVFWFNHIQSGLSSGTGISNAFFSYWASLGQPNYGPTNPNPAWKGIVITNNFISGKLAMTQGNCQATGSLLTSSGVLNCGAVATTGPGAVNYTCNVQVSHAMIATQSTTDTLPAGNVDSSDHTFASVGFNNFNFDNLGAGIANLNDITLANTSPYFTGVSASGCTSDGLPTGANIGLLQQYTAGVN